MAKGGRRPEMVADRTLCLLNALAAGCCCLLGEDTSRGGGFAACSLAMYLQNVALALIKWVRKQSITIIFS